MSKNAPTCTKTNSKLQSFVLSNTLEDSDNYMSLSNEDYVKKIMSLATNEYPINSC